MLGSLLKRAWRIVGRHWSRPSKDRLILTESVCAFFKDKTCEGPLSFTTRDLEGIEKGVTLHFVREPTVHSSSNLGPSLANKCKPQENPLELPPAWRIPRGATAGYTSVASNQNQRDAFTGGTPGCALWHCRKKTCQISTTINSACRTSLWWKHSRYHYQRAAVSGPIQPFRVFLRPHRSSYSFRYPTGRFLCAGSPKRFPVGSSVPLLVPFEGFSGLPR